MKNKHRSDGHPEYDEHHVHPKSRGGSNDWNKVRVNYNLHHGFNKIFMHSTVYETIVIIKQCWTDENGNLKYWLLSKEQAEEWVKLFKTLETEKVIEILMSKLAHHPENFQKYERWLENRKENYKKSILEILRKCKKNGGE